MLPDFPAFSWIFGLFKKFRLNHHFALAGIAAGRGCQHRSPPLESRVPQFHHSLSTSYALNVQPSRCRAHSSSRDRRCRAHCIRRIRAARSRDSTSRRVVASSTQWPLRARPPTLSRPLLSLVPSRCSPAPHILFFESPRFPRSRLAREASAEKGEIGDEEEESRGRAAGMAEAGARPRRAMLTDRRAPSLAQSSPSSAARADRALTSSKHRTSL